MLQWKWCYSDMEITWVLLFSLDDSLDVIYCMKEIFM